MAYATAADVEGRLVGRTLDVDEAAIVETRLDDVEALIQARIPDLDDKITSGTLNQRLVVMVEAEAVLRLIRNPEGMTQETDGNYSYSIDAKVASGRLSILPEEWTLLGFRRSVVLLSPQISMPTWDDVNYNPNGDFEPELDTAVWA